MPFLQTQPVDLLILDVKMLAMSGIEVTRQVRPVFPALPILAVSMQTDYESVRAMFDAGANGFYLKSAGRSELLQALNRVSRGEVSLSPELATVLTRPAPLAATSALTTREREIA